MSTEEQLAAAASHVALQLSLDLKGDLGRGAFKRAYLATGEHGEVALKIAPIIGPIDRLEREAAALRGCTHPNIATLVDAFATTCDGKQYWVVLERFVPGGTLESKLAAGPLEVAFVRTMGIALATALDHLDARRLVHRDIKPANILFDADHTTPVLTDFGIVRALDLPTLTRDFGGFGPGTPAYASPEQLNNEKHLIDWRTDQFDLALVLAECVLGHHPFMVDGGNLHSAIVAVSSRQTLPVSSGTKIQALGFGNLVRALSPWPIERYRRPHHFIAALTG